MQPDPLADDYPELTPYQYASDDPIANVDIDGLLSGAAIADAAKPFNQVQTLAGVVVYLKPAVTAGSVTRSFFSGLLNSALSTLKGIVHVIAHPLTTAAALGNVALHPIKTVEALKNIVVNTYRVFKAGDANVKSKMIGHAAGDIVQLFIGTGEVKAGTEIAEDVGTLSKVVKETEEVEDVGIVNKAEKIVKHHSDPKFMGGDKDQELTKMYESDHKALHKDLNNHLVKYKDEAGNHMRPQRGNSGIDIQRNFSPEERIKAMKDFYNGPGSKYKQAAKDFFKQHN